MASIYFNGTEIDEVDDDVYFNGTALSIGDSVYFNGTAVWTKQLGCIAFTSGTTYSQWNVSGSTTNQNDTTIESTTVSSNACASSQCSVRVGASISNLDTSVEIATAKILHNGTQIVTASDSSDNGSAVYSSWVTRTVSPTDTFVLQGRVTSGVPFRCTAYGQINTGNSGTLLS